ncbi:hypothetical protein RFI_20068, partial [Reticulomyxa filosa]
KKKKKKKKKKKNQMKLKFNKNIITNVKIYMQNGTLAWSRKYATFTAYMPKQSSSLRSASSDDNNGQGTRNTKQNKTKQKKKAFVTVSEAMGCVQMWQFEPLLLDETRMNNSNKGVSDSRNDDTMGSRESNAHDHSLENVAKFNGTSSLEWNGNDEEDEGEKKSSLILSKNGHAGEGNGIKKWTIHSIHKEMHFAYLNELPTCMYVIDSPQQIFIGTQLGNVYQYDMVVNKEMEVIGILPNPKQIKVMEQWNVWVNLNDDDSILSRKKEASKHPTEKLRAKLLKERQQKLFEKREQAYAKIQRKKLQTQQGQSKNFVSTTGITAANANANTDMALGNVTDTIIPNVQSHPDHHTQDRSFEKSNPSTRESTGGAGGGGGGNESHSSHSDSDHKDRCQSLLHMTHHQNILFVSDSKGNVHGLDLDNLHYKNCISMDDYFILRFQQQQQQQQQQEGEFILLHRSSDTCNETQST